MASLVRRPSARRLAGLWMQLCKGTCSTVVAHGLSCHPAYRTFLPGIFLFSGEWYLETISFGIIIVPKLSQWTRDQSDCRSMKTLTNKKHSYIHNMQSLLFISINICRYMLTMTGKNPLLPARIPLALPLMPSFEKRKGSKTTF